jgi:hypothetical protein
MRYSSRFFLYAPFGLLLILAVLAMGHWWQVAGAVDAKLKAMKGREAVPGVTLDWKGVTVSGFPFRLDIVFDRLVVQGQGAHGPFAWTTDKFAVHALTYGARKDVFEAEGSQRLSWTDAAGVRHDAAFLPGSLRASAVRDASGLSRFDADIIELDGRNSPNGAFSIGRAQLHLRRDPDGKSIDLMAQGDLVRAPGPLGAARTFHVYQTLSQGSAFAGLLRGEKKPAEAHALWLLAGGAVKITQSELNGATTLAPAQRDAALALLAPLY